MRRVYSIIYWSPRVLAIMLALFISMLALDAFTEGYSLWQALLLFLKNLIPAYIVTTALLLAWKWETIGGSFFLLLSFLYVYKFWGLVEPWAYAVFSGSAFLIGVLFLVQDL